jgi:hypothetical protein
MVNCQECFHTPHTEDCTRTGKRVCVICDSIIPFKPESYSIHRQNASIYGYAHKECIVK